MKMILFILILNLFVSVLKAPEYHQLTIIQKTDMLCWKNVDYWLWKYQVKQPEIVKAQIWLETGNLSSFKCRVKNNLTGMKLAKTRATTASGEYKYSAYYNSWQESIEDYAIWQNKYYRGGDYLVFLKEVGYAEDKLYIQKLKNIYTRHGVT